MPNIANILQRTTIGPTKRSKPTKIKKIKKKRRISAQEQKYHLNWRWRRRKS